MAEIIVKTQAELDALPDTFPEYTVIQIHGGTPYAPLIIRKLRNSRAELRENSRAELWENSRAVLRGNSSAVLRGNSSAVLRGNSSAVLWGNSSAELRENSSAELRENSSAELWGNSSAVLWENSSAELWGNSRAELRENSRAELRENSRAVLWGNSRAVLWGNSRAELWENSRAELWGNSRAELWGNSRAVLRENSSAHAYSAELVTLHGLAVLWQHNKVKTEKRSKTALIRVVPEYEPIRAKNGSPKDWLTKNCVEPKAGKLLLYKRVSKDFKTQEGAAWETTWLVGSKMEHPAWNPSQEECHAGKYHACSRPYQCNQFRDKPGDRYIAIEVAVKDLYAWDRPSYPDKIAFRAGTILYECDHLGRKL